MPWGRNSRVMMTLYHLQGQQKGVGTCSDSLFWFYYTERRQQKGARYLGPPAGEGEHKLFVGKVMLYVQSDWYILAGR